MGKHHPVQLLLVAAAAAAPSVQKTAAGWENTMGKHHPVQLVLVAAAAAAVAAAAAPSVQKTAVGWVVEVVVVRNKGQKSYSLARSPLRLPGSADSVACGC